MKMIILQTEKDLRIYSLPLRQKILREMRYFGRPVTAKEIADRLQITPSAAQHHIKQLMSIGLIEFDHMQVIRGIQAQYMRLADVTVSIGQQYADALSDMRDEAAKGMLMEALNGFMHVVHNNRKSPMVDHAGGLNDILTGIVHLTFEEAEEFYRYVFDFLNAHTEAGTDTKPWEIAMLGYRMDLTQLETKE